MTTLIIGMGQVGSALHRLIPEASAYDAAAPTVQSGLPLSSPIRCINQFDFVHVCFGYSPSFVAHVQQYADWWRSPEGTVVIHSTVPAGTTRKCGRWAVHSPVHGKHPDLESGLRTFTKYVGGCELSHTVAVVEHLKRHGMPAKVVSSPEASELSKRWCLRQYALSILAEKLCAADCERWGVPLDEVYSGWNAEYNAGWQAMGYGQTLDITEGTLKPVLTWQPGERPQFTRPILEHKPGPIGGHCVLQNSQHTPWEPIDHTILSLAEDVK